MATKKFPSFKKPKGLKRLPGLGKKKRMEPLPDLDAGPERIANLVDPEVVRLTTALGSEQLAKKLLKLREKFPDATVPELVVMEFLDRRGVKYEFQKWLIGGRAVRGGQVVDFAVDMGSTTYIWEVQGNFWHDKPGKIQADEAQKFALLGLSVFGKKVGKVISLWESRLMDKQRRSATLEAAMTGTELGK